MINRAPTRRTISRSCSKRINRSTVSSTTGHWNTQLQKKLKPYDDGCYLHGSKYAYQISGSSCGRTACKAFLAFVQQGTHVFLSQLNTEMNVCRTEAEQFQSRLLRSETDCHEERQTAVWLTSQNMSLNYNSCTSLRDSTEELRKSLDDNRSTLLEYLGQEFEEMLQWEESECFSSFSCEPSPILNICGLRRTPSSS